MTEESLLCALLCMLMYDHNVVKMPEIDFFLLTRIPPTAQCHYSYLVVAGTCIDFYIKILNFATEILLYVGQIYMIGLVCKCIQKGLPCT